MQLSEGEWRVMNVVWSKHPVATRTVMQALAGETGWAYTTVKTMLDRLVEKGALSATMSGNRAIYRPAISRGEARRSAVRALMDRAFDAAFGPFLQFLVSDERLSDADKAELVRLLKELEEKDIDTGTESENDTQSDGVS